MNDKTQPPNEGGDGAKGKQKQQRPSIGRVVHSVKPTQKQPRASVITGLHEDSDAVDLTVFTNNPANPVVVLQAQPLVEAGAEGANGWCWPPRS